MTSPASNKLKAPARMLTFGGLAVLALGLAHQFLTPKVYRASAMVRLENRGLGQMGGASGKSQFSEKSSLPDEVAYMNTDLFLNRVIDDLGPRNALGTNTDLRLLRSK